MFVILAALLACGGTSEAPGDAAEAPTDGEKQAKSGKRKGGKRGRKAKNPPAPVEKTTVQVFFVDTEALNEGREPLLVPVERKVGAKAPQKNALWVMFKGPTDEEKERGLSLVASGAEGFEDFSIDGGVASLKLRGGCEGGGATTTVFDQIRATLTAFDDIEHVKVYDPQGQTMMPDTPGDSRPECLEP